MATENWITERSPGYVRWDIPAQAWSGAEYGDDSLRIICDHGKWRGITEFDQCVKRDLSDDEVASARSELGLVA